MIAADTDLDALFKRLHLANARRVWRGLIDRAEREHWAYRDFLTLLATEEIAHRQQTRLARLTRRAHFPFLKTIDDFNFTYQSSLRLQMLGSALAPDFVTEGRSIILAGKPGRGKTHLAIAIAYRAIQNGFDAFFTTAATLIDDLSAAFRAGELAHALPTYTHPAVLVVDEVGYLTYGTDAANMLFHVVNERHRRHRPMIFTTNKSLKAWGRVLHDDDLAQAIIDRVLERGRLLRLDGPSVRTLHVNLDEAMKEDSDQQADLIRFSGNSRSEFPEPTWASYHPLRDAEASLQILAVAVQHEKNSVVVLVLLTKKIGNRDLKPLARRERSYRHVVHRYLGRLRMRINGRAEVRDDPDWLAMCPGSVETVKVTVEEVYKQNRPAVKVSESTRLAIHERRERRSDDLDETLEETFPASDAPANTVETGIRLGIDRPVGEGAKSG